MYDILIVGAGPAGANLARLLGGKYRILLLDRRALDKADTGGAIKCCGGLLAPDAQKMIATLGLGVPKDVLVDPQLFAVRAIDLDNRIERLYQRFYFNMDREKFDRWLVSLIPAQVDKHFGVIFQDFTKTPDGFEVRYLQNGRPVTVQTKILVGADGANSKVRRLIGGDQNMPRSYIAVQERFIYPDDTHCYTAVFDKTISDFYAWLIPKNNELLLGAALPPGKDAREKFELLKTKLTPLGFSFDRKIRTEGAFLYRPSSPSQLFTGRDNTVLVGEASGAISPSSAEGISYALKSSLFLAQSLEKGTDGFMDRYEKAAREIKRNLTLKNLKSPGMYMPALRQAVMKSGFLSIR